MRPSFPFAVVAAAAALSVVHPASAQVRLSAYSPSLSASDFAAAERDQELRDQVECIAVGERDGKVTPMFVGAPGGLAGAVIAGAATGLITGAMESSRKAGSIRQCMAERGYQPLAFTAAQQAALGALHGEARTKWLAATPGYAPRRDSSAYALLMWDPTMNRPVAIRRDLLSGEISRSWTFNR